MKRKTVIYSSIIIIELAVLVIIAILLSQPTTGPDSSNKIYMPAFIAGLCTSLMAVFLVRFVLRKKGRAAKEDERSFDIAYKSAYRAYYIIVPQLALGAIFLMIYGNGDTGWEHYVGTTLLMVCLLMMATYTISFLITNRGMQKDG